MAFLSTDPATDMRTADVPRPEFHSRTVPKSRRWPILGLIDAWFSDERLNISRPKLLFATSAVDFLIVMLSGALALAVTGGGENPDRFFWAAVVVAVATVSVLQRRWAYTIPALRRVSSQIEKILFSLALVFSVAAGVSFLAGVPLFAPRTDLAWLAVVAMNLILFRVALARVIEHLNAEGRLSRRTVIVGGGPEAASLIAALERDKDGGIQILGLFDDRDDERSSDTLAGYAKLGNFEQLSHFCRDAGVDLLIVTVPTTAETRLLQILQRLFTMPVDVRISAMNSKLRFNDKAYTQIGGVPMLAVMDRPLTDWDRAIKNLEDRILGTALFLIAAPVMALVALAVRFESKGPILFKQRRYGFNNELIEVYKFRSMYADKTDANAAKLVTKNDSRVTRVGRFIRRTSLDELPQLINVIKGEMSLVGPRPHATEAKAENDLYQSVVAGYFARHRMKPGVTGWAQLKGWRGETDTHEKIQRRVEHDLYYIDNWSVPLDLYIIAMTPLVLLSGKNAY